MTTSYREPAPVPRPASHRLLLSTAGQDVDVLTSTERVAFRLRAAGASFAFEDTGGKQLVAVERARRWWGARYVMKDSAGEIGIVEESDIWRSRYSILFTGGATWRVHVPLFGLRHESIRCGDGRTVRLRIVRMHVWDLWLDDDTASPPLLAGLTLACRCHFTRA